MTTEPSTLNLKPNSRLPVTCWWEVSFCMFLSSQDAWCRAAGKPLQPQCTDTAQGSVHSRICQLSANLSCMWRRISSTFLHAQCLCMRSPSKGFWPFDYPYKCMEESHRWACCLTASDNSKGRLSEPELLKQNTCCLSALLHEQTPPWDSDQSQNTCEEKVQPGLKLLCQQNDTIFII